MNKSRLTAILSAAATALSMTGMTGYAADTASEKTVDQMLSEMTTKQKVEQMIAITLRPWTGGEKQDNLTSLNPELTKLIREHNFSGVTLFAPNIESAEQCAELTDQIQQAALSSECGIPMLICADQEGGSIYRIATGTLTCGNMANGAAGDPALAEENAKILGNEMKSVGINTDLAPVLDVNNNPANPVINVRSFSSDPKIVSEMGASYLKGLQSEGVITTCKHFPGHGDTNTDSHTGLPLINKNYDELKNMELYPYDAAIKAGTDMIMTAHIQFPQIETGTYISTSSGEKVSLPATLSKTMITGILRNDLGYDGVVTTDSMMMDAIQKNFDNVDAAVLAINADVDIMLEPMYVQNSEDIAKMEKYVADITKRVEDGEISAESIDKSVTRILTMKQNRGVLDYEAPSTENAMKIVGSAENREKALQIAEKGVTLVKNDDDILPLKPMTNDPLLGALYGGKTTARTACAEALESDAPLTSARESAGFSPVGAGRIDTPSDMTRIQAVLRGALGVVRDEQTMQSGLGQLAPFDGARALLGRAALMSALARKESRGAHYREDYPARDDAFLKKTIAVYDGRAIRIHFESLPERRNPS